MYTVLIIYVDYSLTVLKACNRYLRLRYNLGWRFFSLERVSSLCSGLQIWCSFFSCQGCSFSLSCKWLIMKNNQVRCLHTCILQIFSYIFVFSIRGNLENWTSIHVFCTSQHIHTSLNYKTLKLVDLFYWICSTQLISKESHLNSCPAISEYFSSCIKLFDYFYSCSARSSRCRPYPWIFYILIWGQKLRLRFG